jgi:hypothetical protein
MDLGINSTAVATHVNVYQNIISRMAEDSRNLKAWCVTLVSAVAITSLSVDGMSWIVYLLISTFCLLDSYYLAQERAFRDSYNEFIDNLHRHVLSSSDIYVIKRQNINFLYYIKALLSLSEIVFYSYISLGMFLFISKFGQ